MILLWTGIGLYREKYNNSHTPKNQRNNDTSFDRFSGKENIYPLLKYKVNSINVLVLTINLLY